MIRNDVYRGYIKINGKTPIEPFKEGCKLHSYEEIKNEPSFGGVIGKEYVLFDFDDKEQSDIALDILKEFDIKFLCYETTRGKHFIFRNNGRCIDCKTKTPIAIGLTVDIKSGITNSYEKLKDNGIERKRLDLLPDNETPDEVPLFFTPLERSEDVFKMSEGDGRNDAIFRHIINIMNSGLSKDETKLCLDIINKYILAEPLSKKEFETVTRDDAFPETIFKDKHGKFNKVMAVEYFISRYKIKKIQGALYIYDGRRYAPVILNGDNLLNHYVYKALPTLKNSVRNDIIADIVNRLTNCEDATKIEPTHVCFKNGLLNLKTLELESHTPNLFVVNYIPHNYNPTAYNKKIDDALNLWCCNDKEVRTVLEEAIGICLSSSTASQKMFVIQGNKNNGKSTFFKVLAPMLGSENVSSLGLNEVGERFCVQMLKSKLANIGDDISDKPLDADCISRVKKIVTGESLKAEYKGIDGFCFRPYATLFFSTNNMPSVKDETGAFARRLVIIPFDHDFSNTSTRETDYEDELCNEESFEYLIRLGVERLHELMNRKWEITQSKRCQARFDKIVSHLDTVKDFVKTNGSETIFNNTPSEVFNKYAKYCREMETIALPKNVFRDAIIDLLDCKVESRTINNQPFKVFVPKRIRSEK